MASPGASDVDRPGGAPVPPAAGRRPRGLLLAAVVVGLQGLALVGFGGWLAYELSVSTSGNRKVAGGSAAYFLTLGPLILLVALALYRRHGWAGGAAIFLELLALPMSYYMFRAGFYVGGVPLLAAAVATLVALMSAPVRAALGR